LSANDIDVGSSGFTPLFNQPAYLAGRPSILNGKSGRLLSGILLVFIRFGRRRHRNDPLFNWMTETLPSVKMSSPVAFSVVL
jgi:hypothetical protein